MVAYIIIIIIICSYKLYTYIDMIILHVYIDIYALERKKALYCYIIGFLYAKLTVFCLFLNRLFYLIFEIGW